MDQLERRVEKLVSENNNFRQKVKTLSDENSNLLKELQQLLFTSLPKNQSLVISRNAKRLLRADLEEKIDSSLEWERDFFFCFRENAPDDLFFRFSSHNVSSH